MILVTGATGNLGASVLVQLMKISTPAHFIVSSSNEVGVSRLKAQGLQARLANFNDSATLDVAFKGVDKLLLISTMDPNRLEQHKNVIDAAKAQGVQHIIYTGLAIKNIETSGVTNLMKSHFDTEAYIKQSGMTYTMVRNTMYADALTQILNANRLTQGIQLPGGSGKVPYALRREMGEGIANLLLQEGHENKVYHITGSSSYSYQDLAQVLTELTDTTIHYHDIDEDDFKNSLQQTGFPEFAIYLHAGTVRDIKTQQYEIKSLDLEHLLGRPTATAKEFLKELFSL